MSGEVLEADLREAARVLVDRGRLRAEAEPELYRAAVKGQAALAGLFRSELGWTFEVLEVAQLVRLHKRRVDVPGDRGPSVARGGGRPVLLSQEALVLVCLVCEQLWRRPRLSVRELMQALAQVCAEEAASGGLPRVQWVAGEGTSKQEARWHRQNLVDALQVLEAEGSVEADSDLERVVVDEDADLVVTASRDRLAARFSSLSPALLGLDVLPPQEHAAALSTASLLDPVAPEPDQTASLEERRLQALRRLVDDPGVDPFDEQTSGTAYLHTLAGRERGLALLAGLGLGVTVRRDWWEVTDPSGLGTAMDFPNGRRMERQAALALLAHLSERDRAGSVVQVGDVVELLEGVRAVMPNWAAGHKAQLPALARAAISELTAARLLVPVVGEAEQWQATPGVHLWRVRVAHAARGTAGPEPGEASGVEPTEGDA
ncbi:DUF2398 family protein [Streptomyces plumbiresistens]|uniref:DUF2398 family protein n=1 Tax=Streptomyces plumbiresistens TaxID=511811 RepID=A0ABP7TL12_9ACTN